MLKEELWAVKSTDSETNRSAAGFECSSVHKGNPLRGEWGPESSLSQKDIPLVRGEFIQKRDKDTSFHTKIPYVLVLVTHRRVD